MDRAVAILMNLALIKAATGKGRSHKKKDPTPELVDHVAARIMKEHPEYTREQAYRIAVKRLQQYGYLRKGTMQLTEKGKRQSQKHYKHRRAMDWRKRPY